MDISNLTNAPKNWNVIFKLSNRLVKLIMKNYQPNEIYASQWINLFMVHSMLCTNKSNILSEATLTELIDNNKRVLESKISFTTIANFLKLLVY